MREGPKPSGTFLLRTPLLPVDTLTEWHDTVSGGAAPWAYIRKVAHAPEVLHALFVGSPAAHDGLSRWLAESSLGRAQRMSKTLARYLSRMAGRATPFGLFAGCSSGVIKSGDEDTRFEIGPLSEYQCHPRLDHDYVELVNSYANRESVVRAATRWYTNDTLYKAAGRYRYVETVVSASRRDYNLVGAVPTMHLDVVLAHAECGASLDDLVGCLVREDSSLSPADARDYLEQLIDGQLLVSDLSSALTGRSTISDWIARLSAIPAMDNAARVLRSTLGDLDAITARGVRGDIEPYRTAARRLGRLPIPLNTARMIQVDLSKPLRSAKVSTKIVRALCQGVEALRLTAPPLGDPFKTFRERFVERYERAAVPLMEVLDEESGIGFDHQTIDDQPLLDGLPIAVPQVSHASTFTPRDEWLLGMFLRWHRSGDAVLTLEQKDIHGSLNRDSPRLPDSFGVLCMVGRRPDHTEYVVMRSVAGPSGARMLGRFAVWDDELASGVRSHIAQEESLDPSALFAEVVHQPTGRLGNIQARPVLRNFEIPIMCRSGVTQTAQIPVSDLFVRVVGETVVLWSKTHNREVVPRLSTAHNYRHGITPYRFLCALQSQGVAEGLMWSWGVLRNEAFLPRVVHGDTVLARAQWRLDRQTITTLTDSSHDCQNALQRWRHDNNVPRWILVTDSDNELPVDLDNRESVDMLVDLLSGRRTVTLTEMLPTPDEVITTGPEGRFVSELIVPFISPRAPARSADLPRLETNNSRHWPPGSEWSFVKLYCGRAVADDVLTSVIKPMADDLIASQAVDHWFFIRYSDPHWHLRIRLHGASHDLMGCVSEHVRRYIHPLVRCGLVWRVQFDTYQREIERYGGPESMLVAEQLFWHDSVAAVDLIGLTEGGGDRWRACLLSYDRLLDDVAPTGAKPEWLSYVRQRLGMPFGDSGTLRRALAKRFRTERPRLEALYHGRDTPAHDLLRQALERRSACVRPLFETLRGLERSNRVGVSVRDMTLTYLHMNANRLLRVSSQPQEFAIVDLLGQLAKSFVARRDSARRHNTEAASV